MSQKSTTIDLEIQTSNRVYLPRSVRKQLGLEVGDWVKLKIEKKEEQEIEAS